MLIHPYTWARCWVSLQSKRRGGRGFEPRIGGPYSFLPPHIGSHLRPVRFYKFVRFLLQI